MVKKNSLFYLVIVSLTMKMVLIDVVMSLFSEGSPFILHAQVDFFSSSPKPGSLGELGYGSVKNRVGEKASQQVISQNRNLLPSRVGTVVILYEVCHPISRAF